MAARILVEDQTPNRVEVDAVVVPYSKELPKEVLTELKKREYTGAWGAAEMIVAPRGMKAKFAAVVGLGDSDDPAKRAEGMRRALGKVVAEARQQVLREVAVDVGEEDDAENLARAAVEAAILADYIFAEHNTKLAKRKRTRSLKALTILVDSDRLAAVRQAASGAQRVMDGVNLTRDLVSQPASHVSPKMLVDVAKEIAKDSSISLKVMNQRQAEKDNWRAFLAVARGSEEEPYVIHLTYTPQSSLRSPRGKSFKKVVLVGKGITFDSGGLSLKPANAMEDMKIDMAGAATVLGVFAALPKLGLNVEVHGIIAACENMPSGTAYRPGDVIEARSGKTMEILNTDAEGRVTLADALDYGSGLEPDAMIDLATLTGAAVVGLGETYAGLFSNDQELNDALLSAATWAGEGLEDLPMPEEYQQHIDSKVADVKNATSNHPYGGAITAAMFLQEFVGKTPWAHMDIAGPSYTDKPIIPYWTFGGTGYGVRTLVEFLRNFA